MKQPEKNARLRFRFRVILCPRNSSPPALVTVNCWRLSLYPNSAIAPVVDGVNLELFQTNSPVIRQPVPLPYVIGGAYDQEGRPVYINQTLSMGSSAVADAYVLLLEEYMDNDSRQNQ